MPKPFAVVTPIKPEMISQHELGQIDIYRHLISDMEQEIERIEKGLREKAARGLPVEAGPLTFTPAPSSVLPFLKARRKITARQR